MVFQLRKEDGSIDPFSSGTFIALDGSTRHLDRESFEIRVEDTWRSRETGAEYPARWTIVVPAEDLDTAVEAEVAPYLDCAPGAVAAAKALTRYLGPPITEEVVEHSIAQLVACWEGEETPEGISAFFARRKPSWQTA